MRITGRALSLITAGLLTAGLAATATAPPAAAGKAAEGRVTIARAPQGWCFAPVAPGVVRPAGACL